MRRELDKIVSQIDVLMAEIEQIRTNPDAWWKERQQRLCPHESIKKVYEYWPTGPEDTQDSVCYVCEYCDKVIDDYIPEGQYREEI